MKREHGGRGFTLVELAVVTAIIGLMAMILVPSAMDVLEKRRLEAEAESMNGLGKEIQRSFFDADYTRNIAAFPASMPAGAIEAYATAFGISAGGLARTNDWLVKLGNLRGLTPQLGMEVTRELQPGLYGLAFNDCGQARMLIAGPTTEANQQRYLLVSLMAPLEKGLVLPANDGSLEWFDSLWNHDWENEGSGIPAAWTERLTESQRQAWAKGRGTTTNAHFLVVHRILQPKFSVIVNNTHPTLSGWVDMGGRPSVLTSNAGDPPQTAAGVLAGTLVVFRRGLPSAAPGVEGLRVFLNGNTAFTVTTE